MSNKQGIAAGEHLTEAKNAENGNGTQIKPAKSQKILKSLKFINPGKKVKEFAEFKPEESEREKRKIRRLQEEEHLRSMQRSTMYNAQGLIATSGQDLCDCLDEDCPGCHYSCKECKSLKCGPVCRCKRKWVFDQVEDEGQHYLVKFKDRKSHPVSAH